MPRGRKRVPETAARDDVELANLPPMIPAGSVEIPMSPMTPSEQRREVEIEDILSELGTDGKIKVARVSDAGTRQHVGELPADTFTLDVLADTYGGGRYFLRFFQGKAEVSRSNVEVDPAIPPRNPRAPKVVPGQAPPPVGIESLASVMASMTGMMMQSMQMQQQMSTSMVTAVTTLLAARPAEKDPLDTALRMAEAMKPAGNGGGGGALEAFQYFEKGMSLAEKLGKSDDDGVMPTIAKGVDILGDLIGGIVAEKKANAAAVAAGTSPNPPADAARQIAPGARVATNDRPWVAAARPHMNMLFAMAGRVQPASAADMVSGAMSDEAFADLVADITDETAPGFGGRLKVAFPSVATVDPEWVGALVTELLEFVDDGSPDEPDEPEPAPDITPAGA